MSNTNLPPSFLVELTRELGRTVTAIKQLVNGVESLKEQLPRQFSPIQNLTSVFEESEKLQLQALAAGTTYGKFLDANTQSMKGLISSNQSLTRFMLTGFSRGLRDVSDETMKLADVMNITGEDTDQLATTFGDLRFITGDSINTTRSLAKTIMDTTKETGVSRGQLVQALNSFQDVLFQTSLYGENAVAGLAELSLTLKGGLAGAQGADRAINSLLGMQDSLNVAQQSQLGLREFFDDIRQNGFNADRHLQMLIDASDNLNKMMGQDPMTRSSISRAFGETEVRSLTLIGDRLKNSAKTGEEMKATAEDNLNSMKVFEERKRAFFEKLAPDIHSTITRVLPLLALSQSAGQGLMALSAARTNRRVTAMGQMRSSLRSTVGMSPTAAASVGLISSAQKNTARLAARTAATQVAKFGLRRVAGTLVAGLAGGPLGVGLAALTFIPDIVSLLTSVKDSSAKTAEATEQQNKKTKLDMIEAQRQIAGKVSLARELLAQQGLLSGPEGRTLLMETNTLLRNLPRELAAQIAASNISTGSSKGNQLQGDG